MLTEHIRSEQEAQAHEISPCHVYHWLTGILSAVQVLYYFSTNINPNRRTKQVKEETESRLLAKESVSLQSVPVKPKCEPDDSLVRFLKNKLTEVNSLGYSQPTL